MTVCIAALCDDGQGVVLASDQMVTAHIPIGYEFEHEAATKIVPLRGETLMVLLSGDVLRGHEVVETVRKMLAQQSTAAEVSELIRSCYQEIRRRCVIQSELEPRGLDINAYYNNHQQLVPPVVQVIDEHLANWDMGVEMLIAGHNDDTCAIYSIVHPGIVHNHSAIGHAAIGSGAPHALYSLIETGYRPSMPQDVVVELVERAKARSEVAPGVGSGTAVVIIPSSEENHAGHE